MKTAESSARWSLSSLLLLALCACATTPRQSFVTLKSVSHETRGYVPPNPELAGYVKNPTNAYRLVPGGLLPGQPAYTDRAYVFTKIPPAFKGLTLLQTSMGHKAVASPEYKVALSASRPITVFVAVDERMLEFWNEQGGKPEWFQDYAPAHEKLLTDDLVMRQAQFGYEIFQKNFPPGEIVLGPPAGDDGNNAMYIVFFAEN